MKEINDNNELALKEKIEELKDSAAWCFIKELGDSPYELSPKSMKRIKRIFPIPQEFEILWADVETGLRPSGIVCTDKGVFIKTDVSVFLHKKDREEQLRQYEQTVEKGKKQKKPKRKLINNASALYYYSWDNFDIEWFVGDSKEDNIALLVDSKCSNAFIQVCKRLQEKEDKSDLVEFDELKFDSELINVKPGIVAAAAVESAEAGVFVETNAQVNYIAGRGFMAEQANNMLDRLQGLDAKVVGGDNAKDGADRKVGDAFIQTKYYRSAVDSVYAAFADHGKGNYRYYNADGTPMELEVPKDQYEAVIERFKARIRKGQVPGITNPEDAYKIIRKGRITYKQAVNLTKPGTIESLAYDAATGVVTCSCAFGISFVAMTFLVWHSGTNMKEALKAGITSGIQVFGLSFLQHVLISQIGRTNLAYVMLRPSQALVEKLGYQTSAKIVNGIRALAGKSPIYGAAAAKNLAKIFRSNVITSVITFAVFSIPDTYKIASRKISGSQYVKNMVVLLNSIAGSTGAAVGTGVAAAKVAGVIGTTITPGVGTVIGIMGGFIGGVVAGEATRLVGDIFVENDSIAQGRILNAYICDLVGEYFLDESEIDKLMDILDKIDKKTFKKFFETLSKSDNQDKTLREFLEPKFETVIKQRPKFKLPSDSEILEAMSDLFDDPLREHHDKQIQEYEKDLPTEHSNTHD